MLRERGKAFARARAGAGASVEAIAAELGIAERTAERWIRTETTASLVPVRVVDVAATTSTRSVVVTTPSGLRLEGLDLAAVCTLVARFG